MTGTTSESNDAATADLSTRPRKFSSRFMLLIRRIHLYAGLFMLPWVLLYGITGAMFNHQGLLPQDTFRPVTAEALATSPMAEFPPAGEFAQQIVDTLQTSAGDATIALAENHGAEFTNNMMFEVHADGQKHIVHIDPANRTSYVASQHHNDEELPPVLSDIRNIKLHPDPRTLAHATVSEVLRSAGIASGNSPKPYGWTKLNFLATVNGEPVRVTYVLKDGHVDITKHTGEDGIISAIFFYECTQRTDNHRTGMAACSGQLPSTSWRSRWSCGH